MLPGSGRKFCVSGIPLIIESGLPSTGCGGIFQAPSGEIHSPNYPSPYRSNTECTWLIQVEKNHRVLLNFTDFDLEPQDSCIMVSDTHLKHCLQSRLGHNIVVRACLMSVSQECFQCQTIRNSANSNLTYKDTSFLHISKPGGLLSSSVTALAFSVYWHFVLCLAPHGQKVAAAVLNILSSNLKMSRRNSVSCFYFVLCF